MSFIESTKSYTGSELETIFFRPMLTGGAAEELGIKVLYNMPVPTTVSILKGSESILQKNNGSGWNGSSSSKSQKQIAMARVKAELGYAASDYFSMVFDNLATKQAINSDDLTGSELEVAETEIFSRSIADSLRATMWLGDTTATSGLNTFDGLLVEILAGMKVSGTDYLAYTDTQMAADGFVTGLFDSCWSRASSTLRDMKGDGELVYYVTSDIYALYEKHLDENASSASYAESIAGRQKLYYHGIEIHNVRLEEQLATDYPDGSFVILTDRRNFVMAVNTADYPGSEIRMWYNPDEMENRQRASFAVGCQMIDDTLISVALNGMV